MERKRFGYKFKVMISYFLIFPLLLNAQEFSPSAVKPATIQLKKGWNLVTIPVQPTNSNVTAVFAPITNVLESVWTYHNGSWKGYNPSVPGLRDLTKVEFGTAYWIKVREDASLTLYGVGPEVVWNPAVGQKLNPGWNLVGYLGTLPQGASLVFTPIEPHLESAATYTGSGWLWYSPAVQGSDRMEQVNPYQVLWINVKTNTTFSAPNLIGEVIDATTGKPIPNALVTLDGVDSPMTTDSRGRFIATGVPDSSTQTLTVLVKNFTPLVLAANPFSDTGWQNTNNSSNLKILATPLIAPVDVQLLSPQSGSIWVQQ